MNVKTKLRLAFGLLFVVILSFGGISFYYMNKFAQNSKNVVKDNYESLNYSSKMRRVLDENPLPLSANLVNEFNLVLKKEQSNITEVGEQGAVAALAEAYKAVVDPNTTMAVKQDALNKARIQIRIIEELNMNAVVRKNTIAQEEGQKAANYLIFAASLCFILLFSLAVNLPEMVSKSRGQ